MNFLKKYAWYIVGVIVLVIIYKVIKNRIGSTPNDNGGTLPATSEPSFKYDPSAVNRQKTFGVGAMNSQEVAYLQAWVNAYGKTKLAVDGDFGPKTAAAFLAERPATNIISTNLDKLGI